MPWKIEQRDGKYCVIKISDGSNEGCSDTKEKALGHLRALYANEPKANNMAEGFVIENVEHANALRFTLDFLDFGGDWSSEEKAAVHEIVKEVSDWVAQKLGYGDTVDPELGPIQFDRLRVAFGDEAVDYTLQTSVTTNAVATNVSNLMVGTDPQPTETPEEPIPDWSPTAYSWQGPITYEGQFTGDGRFFKPGSVQWDESSLPLPFRWQKASQGGHQAAVTVGRVDQIYRQGNAIMGRGVILSGPDAPPESAEYLGLMVNNAGGGVSIDGDDAQYEVTGDIESPKMVFDSIRLRGLTAVDIPAFINAKIHLDSMSTFSLTAAGILTTPPSKWFANPGLTEPTPVTIGPEGQIFGHLALFDTCHIGFPESKCVMAPKNDSFAYFHTGDLLSADGDSIPVGHLTFRTGHAAMDASAMGAASHYDNTGSVAADVCAGNDKHGIWIAGALRPHLDDVQLREFRAAPLSGDWRRIGGRLHLVAALAVNTPGFPVSRARVLVAGGETSTLLSSESDWRAEMTEADLEARRSLRERLARTILGDTAEYALIASAANLPLADQGRAWDGPGAASRMLNAATTDDKIDKGKAGRGFFKVDGDGSKKGDYHLPFADVIGGTLTAVPRGIFAVAAALQGSRGASIEGGDSIKSSVAAYYHKMNLKAPWEGK